MSIHPWWSGFGKEAGSLDDLTAAPARGLASALAAGRIHGATLAEIRRDENCEAVRFDVDVERPQDLAYQIKGTEPIAVLFPFGGGRPSVLALRDDFPDTMHQNWSPQGAPCSLCVDDRPWAEARLTWTPAELVRQIQLWLAKAARGDLHDAAQPPDPLFFRSALTLVIPPSAVADDGAIPELAGYSRQDNLNVVFTHSAPASGKGNDGPCRLAVLYFKASPQRMTRLRRAPTALAGLAEELERCGIDLLGEIKTRVTAWAGVHDDNLRRLSSLLAIVVAFPVQDGEGVSGNDVRAFLTFEPAGEVGIALGVLFKNGSGVGAQNSYVKVIGEPGTPRPDQVRIEPADVQFSFNREIASSLAGRPEVDRSRVMLIGAGSLGSQLALDLAREGAMSWTVVDQDFLMPHNLARHALLTSDIGAPKAFALASQLSALLGEPFSAIFCDIMNPDENARAELAAGFSDADLIVDASASVAVSRYLADMLDANARRVCAFFNPSGTAAVLLAESRDRSITLRDLEAQYHRALLSDPGLSGHLKTDHPGHRYSGSCRSLSNRIPAARAAILSGLAARGISAVAAQDQAAIRIWTLGAEGDVRLSKIAGAAVTGLVFGSWTVTYDTGLSQILASLRERRLPNETGGVLLGVVDVSRRSIHVVHALSQPEDSRASVAGFERGVAGLRESVAAAVEESMNQLRYVGEWHSHPRGASASPSATDVAQMVWLGSELDAEGVPALMAIAADNGEFSFSLAVASDQPHGAADSIIDGTA